MALGPMPRAHTLDGLTAAALDIDGVWSGDVEAGDWVVVRTKNSRYALRVLANGEFRVSGGWFTENDIDGSLVGVAGCTWGGTCLLTGLIAAPGMFIEFDNGVRTSRVRDVKLLHEPPGPAIH